MKIKVCIPHYFSHQKEENHLDLPGGWVPGSARGTVEKRSQSFAKCLLSLVNMSKNNDYAVLDIRTNTFNRLENIHKKYDISITVMTDGKNICEEVLNKYKNFVDIKEINLTDSRNLIFEAREHLLDCDNYDLYYYCEDDIGITTKNYFDRILWFSEQTNHQGVLMPHRFENPYSPEIEKLYIDGPIDQNLLQKFMIPKKKALSLLYQGKNIVFDKPMNPHSATFCLTKKQRDHIINVGIERRDDFVSAFESVCTLTPMQYFHIYKPCWKHRMFLEVEQYYTNYC
jgi:hypothetical protein